MSDDAQLTFSGEVTDVFGHRFVVKNAAGKILADIGRKGAKKVALKDGDRITISGEMEPSELKVSKITRQGEDPIDIRHSKKSHLGEQESGAPKAALQTAKSKGLTVLGLPRRKPKHFEILGRDKAGQFVELHVELDGAFRKAKHVRHSDKKWAKDIDGDDANHRP